MIELGFRARYLGEKRRTFEYLALKMMMEKKKEEEWNTEGAQRTGGEGES